ncbi:TIGR04255 family protein [Rhodococcus fascians]|nr:TIGR04255 family protein [Rhodococcus fascians]MBY4113897.1 TIGR04255 family protein [Rhodococcus fascians]
MVDMGPSAMVLPSFAQPPVVEVAMGVEFLPLPALTVVPLVDVARTWVNDYPIVQEQPALPPAGGPFGPAGFNFEVSAGVPPIRLWLLNRANTELIQIQGDRFILNWRRISDSESYPRYRYLAPRFDNNWRRFANQVEAFRLGPLQPITAEVSFVNAFFLEPEETLFDVLTILSDKFQMKAAEPSIELVMKLDGKNQYEAVGEQTISVSRTPGEINRVSMTLITRVTVMNEDANPIQDALGRAHAIGVTSFAQLTTPKMHRRWEIKL